ncbi:DoxX family protein (plasmid) [Rhizobium etli bv. phaseoli str. IE4803]|nr:DoxX family protein [Rhizobium etli bv. phaseoli str. IE4803]
MALIATLSSASSPSLKARTRARIRSRSPSSRRASSNTDRPASVSCGRLVPELHGHHRFCRRRRCPGAGPDPHPAALTVLAAIGCVLLQIAAMIFHLSRGEAPALPLNVILLGLSAFILWGRGRRAPVTPRG